jgi:hypothetical protein
MVGASPLGDSSIEITVRVDGRPGDEGSARTGEEQDRGDNLFDPGEPGEAEGAEKRLECAITRLAVDFGSAIKPSTALAPAPAANRLQRDLSKMVSNMTFP